MLGHPVNVMPYFFFACFFGGSFSISIASIDPRETGNLKQVYKSGNKRFWPHYSPHSFTMEQDQRAASLLLLGRWVATPLECAVPAEDCLPLRKSCTTHARTHNKVPLSRKIDPHILVHAFQRAKKTEACGGASSPPFLRRKIWSAVCCQSNGQGLVSSNGTECTGRRTACNAFSCP